MEDQKVVSYKGHNYKLLWRGSTQYGERAKLEFMDGSRQFWVAANLVGTAEVEDDRAPKTESQRRDAPTKRCFECGRQVTYQECLENGGDWKEGHCGC